MVLVRTVWFLSQVDKQPDLLGWSLLAAGPKTDPPYGPTGLAFVGGGPEDGSALHNEHWEMNTIHYQPIGVIHSPYKVPKGMPIQPAMASGVAGTVDLLPEYEEGLSDLSGFSHIVLVYHFHLSEGFSLRTKPFLDSVLRGVFATRSPKRPNPIGLSVVRLQRIEQSTIHIVDIDVVDGTPLLDIKPHVPDFFPQEDVRIGWLAGKLRNT